MNYFFTYIQPESFATRIESKSLRCDPTWQCHSQPQGLDLGRKWFFTVLPWTWIGSFFLSVAGVFYLGEYFFKKHGPLRPELVSHFLGWSWLEKQSHQSRHHRSCLHASWRSMFHSSWSGLANIKYVEIVLRLAGGLWSLGGSNLSASVSWMSYQSRTTSSNWRTYRTDQNHGDFEFHFFWWRLLYLTSRDPNTANSIHSPGTLRPAIKVIAVDTQPAGYTALLLGPILWAGGVWNCVWTCLTCK